MQTQSALMLLAVTLTVFGCATKDAQLMLLSNADGDHDIYVLSSSGLDQITSNNHDESHASWSPDGKAIVYTSNQAGNPEIYVCDAASNQQTRLTDHPGLDAWASWSPDSSRIVFVSTRTHRESLFTMDADGGNLAELTPDTQSANLPVWSPRGDVIAFLEQQNGTQSIALIGETGNDHRTLIEAPGVTGLTWSPDGTSLLYSSRRSKNVDIYRIDVATGVELRLTTNGWIDADPAWSPSGQQIVWLSARDDRTRRQVYLMNADGSDKRALTLGSSEHMQPGWSADGKQIAFVAYHNRRFVLQVLDLATGESVSLDESRLGGTHFQPSFNPRGGFVPLAMIGQQTSATSQTHPTGLRVSFAHENTGEVE